MTAPATLASPSRTRVHRRVLPIEGLTPLPAPQCPAFQMQTSYCHPEGEALISDYNQWVRSDVAGAHFTRRSPDNGASWSLPQNAYTPQADAQGGFWRRGESALLLSGKTGFLYRFYNLHYYQGAGFSSDIWWTNKIMVERSMNGGESFEPPQPVEAVNATPPERPRNGAASVPEALAISFARPFTRNDGAIVLPVQHVPRLRREQEPVLRWRAGCLIGMEWEGGVEWYLSQFATLPRKASVRGIFEPAIAESAGGRLLMVARGSNGRETKMKSHKWRSYSDDGGRSWSAPEPFCFSNGEAFYSPSSGSALVRHSGGKLFWLGNLCGENPQGNRPRYPLVMAEVDETSLTLRHETLLGIDDYREGSDHPLVQLSNFRVYEERGSGDLILHLARLGERENAPCPLYEYRITCGTA